MIHQTQLPTKHVRCTNLREHERLNFAAWGTIACLMLASVVAAQDSSASYVISPRVGDVIDAVEREYFGLFPGVKKFISATVAKRADGLFEFSFTGGTAYNTINTTQVVHADVVEELASLIENYERVYRREKQIRWERVAGLAVPTSQTEEDGDGVSVTTTNGEPTTGRILTISDTVLVLWLSPEPYNWRSIGTLTRYFSPSELDQVVIVRKSSVMSGAGTGLLIGGGIGAALGFADGDGNGGWFSLTAEKKAAVLGLFLGTIGAIGGGIRGAIGGIDSEIDIKSNIGEYRSAVPLLNEEAIFRTKVPPELRSISSSGEQHVRRPQATDGDQMYKPYLEPETKSFHISLEGGWMTTRAKDDMKKAFVSSGFGRTTEGWFGGQTTYPLEWGSPLMWKVAAQYDAIDRLRLGLSWIRIPDQQIQGYDDEDENANASSVQLVAEYVLVPVDPQLLNRYEVAIGGGVSYNWLHVGGRISSMFGSAYVQDPQVYELNKRVMGFVLRGSVDYYVSRYISFQSSIELRTIPSIEVPSVTHVNPYNNESKTLIRHSVGFSGTTVTFGPRFHF